ncbi:MAG: preprotein translocase subunit SecG [Dysgonamonadaceae bacterium]|jgi:preprotein translocase subunit SecG|nr:preprotein translocase subunit SecG [Dysgonamonadaceae bacterium]
MYGFITVLIVIAAILLIFIVMIQNSKGGGLAAGFSSSNQVMGVRKTTDFLEKATWSLAGTVVVLCVVAAVFIPKHVTGTRDSEIKQDIQNAITVDPNAVSPFSAPAEFPAE